MKLIEFVTRQEGEIVSDAFITFAKVKIDQTPNRFYFGFCIPAFKLTKDDWCSKRLRTGWYGLQLYLGFGVNKKEKKFIVYRGCYWRLLKETYSVESREY